MSLKIGEMNTLVVKTKSNLGYMLKNESGEEVLLHFKQALKELEDGETVKVFIIQDSEKRITATCETPIIQIGIPGFVKVTNVVENLGIFINNNVFKDPLVSHDDLPLDMERWPIIGDTVLCKLKLTKTQLIAKMISPEEAKSLFKPTRKLYMMEKVEAIVLKNGKEGVNLITLEGHNIFVYYKNKRRDYRIGEKVIVTINHVGEENNFNGTLIDTKAPLMLEDADIILEYMKKNNGMMNFTAKSDLETIEETFKMSKGAFKRALGNLYKRRLIDFDGDKTYLVE